MQSVKKLLVGLGVIFFLLLGFWLAKDNADPVVVRLLGFSMQRLPLGIVLLLVFFSGALLGLVAGTPALVRLTRLNRRMRRALIASNERIADLQKQRQSG